MTPAQEFDALLTGLDQQQSRWEFEYATREQLLEYLDNHAVRGEAVARKRLRNAVGVRLQIAVRAAICAKIVTYPSGDSKP